MYFTILTLVFQNQNMVNLIGLLYAMQDEHYASLIATQKSTYGSALKVRTYMHV